MPIRTIAVFLLLALAMTAAAQQSPAPYRPWIGPDGQPLPFHSDAEVLDFLRTADVISEKNISNGVTVPRKVLLEKDGVRAHAVFRLLDKEDSASSINSLEVGFRDSYLFEPAAYELGILLGLENIPPAVLRKLHGTSGSIQLWVEKAISEDQRIKQQLVAPDALAWERQVHLVRAFDTLVANTDRTRNNLLVTTSDWKLWFIDHTRAFRIYSDSFSLKQLTRCDRAFLTRLRDLKASDVRARTREMLRPAQVSALMKRRDAIVQHFDKLIAERGESSVLIGSPAAAGATR